MLARRRHLASVALALAQAAWRSRSSRWSAASCCGRFPHFAAQTGSRELIMAITLLIVIGLAAATGIAGLSTRSAPSCRPAALGDRIPPPGRDRSRAVQGPAARLVLHHRRHVHRPARGLGADRLDRVGCGCSRSRRHPVRRLPRCSACAAVAAEVAILLAQGGEFAFVVIGRRLADLLVGRGQIRRPRWSASA